MIISGYNEEQELNDSEESSKSVPSWTVRNPKKAVTVAEAQKEIEELSLRDDALAKKLKNKEQVTDADVEAARERVKALDEAAIHAKTPLNKIPDSTDISSWDFLESLERDPLYKRHGRDRSLKASKILYKNIKPTSGYLIPGLVSLFFYEDPETKDKLEWYDKTPCTIFFGYVKNKKGLVRELGFNLHYYPPYVRKKILERIFLMFKKYFLQNFEVPSSAKLDGISYQRLMNSLHSAKLDVGVREYIPGLRKGTRVIPTKFLPTACLTEGNFSGATIQEIYNYWKKF